MSKETLTFEDVGVWKVTTEGSEHTFDMEHLLYKRVNVDGMNPFDDDDQWVPFDPELLKVWPTVGSSFLLILRAHQVGPFHVGTVRISSEIRSIEEVLG